MAEVHGTLRIAGIEPESFVDGPGIRMTIFVQGCPHHCPKCHNPQTHDFKSGHNIDISEILEMISENELLDGITFSGGEPFCHAAALLPLAREIRERGYHLTIYSGYTYEELLEKSKTEPAILELLAFANLLIDGRFIFAERTLDVPFKGSLNQRLINVQATLGKDRVVLWNPGEDYKDL